MSATTFKELFEEKVKANFNKRASSFLNASLTYSQLNELVNQLAYLLNNHFGISTGDVVALMIKPSNELPVAVMAILKLGAVVLPIDIKEHEENKIKILAETNAKVIIIDEDAMFSNIFLDLIHFEGKILPIDLDQISNYPKTNSSIKSHCTDALILYKYCRGQKPYIIRIKSSFIISFLICPNSVYFSTTEDDFSSLSIYITINYIIISLLNSNEIIIYPNNIRYLNSLSLIMKDSQIDVIKIAPNSINNISDFFLRKNTVNSILLINASSIRNYVNLINDINITINVSYEYSINEENICLKNFT